MHLFLVRPIALFMLALAASTIALPHNLRRFGSDSTLKNGGGGGDMGRSGSGTDDDSSSGELYDRLPSLTQQNDLVHRNLIEANALFFVMMGMQKEYEATINTDSTHANSLCTPTFLHDLSSRAKSNSSDCPWSYNMSGCTFDHLRYPHYAINATCHTRVCSSSACSATPGTACQPKSELIHFLKRDTVHSAWKMQQEIPDRVYTRCTCRR